MAVQPDANVADQPGPATDKAPAPREGMSPTRIALQRIRKDKVAMVCAFVALLFVLLAIFGKLLTNAMGLDDQYHQDLLDPNTGLPTFYANGQHPLGVEPKTGRDLFYRWANGVRPSLVVGVLSAVLSVIIGVLMGLLAGFLGGWVDLVISWVIDLLLSLPFILMAFAIVPICVKNFGDADSAGYVEPGRQATIQFVALIVLLTVFGWPQLARLIRGEALSLREREFVQASRAIGAPTSRVVFKEMLPNLLGPIIVNFTVLVPAFIATEAGLSLLGIGLKDPVVSWGQTISQATDYFDTYPIWLWVPVASIVVLVLVLSLLGDAVSDAFNPQTRR